MTHDPFCLHGDEAKARVGYDCTYCNLIAAVREDERKQKAQEVETLLSKLPLQEFP